jgi:ATP-dependent DNA helicase RecQ
MFEPAIGSTYAILRWSACLAMTMGSEAMVNGSESATACGVCDFCAPAECVARRFRTVTEEERTILYRVLRGMQFVPTQSTGKLYCSWALAP